MPSEHANTIEASIHRALKSIPTVWPLQQWIATNPLWEQTDQSIEEATTTLSQKTRAQSTLSPDAYAALYKSGQISDDAIDTSIRSFTDDFWKKHPECTLHHDQKQTINSMIQGFMTDAISEPSLASSCHEEEPCEAMDNHIQVRCFEWLACYFHPYASQKDRCHQPNHAQAALNPFYTFCHTLLSHKSAAWKHFLTPFSPQTPLEPMVHELLSRLSISEAQHDEHIFHICWSLKGWMGYLKWQQQYPSNPYVIRQASPIELLMLWLVLECFSSKKSTRRPKAFKASAPTHRQRPTEDPIHVQWAQHIDEVARESNHLAPELLNTLRDLKPLNRHTLAWLWQRAYEISYQGPLIESLQQNKVSAREKRVTDAQWVFCIDVRSEGYRRHLESIGSHETYGFAGFFGVAYALNNPNNGHQSCQCPALIEPSLTIDMIESTESLCHQTTECLNQSSASNRKSKLAAFALYEMLGIYYAFKIILKNHAPTFVNWLKDHCFSKKQTSTHVPSPYQLNGIDPHTQAEIAKGLLKGMGLTENFSPFVIICGHAATTTNNPYQAAFDCGACGGNSGLSNAIIACQMLNTQAVREHLRLDGIEVPASTRFIAALHDTTTDRIHWHGPDQALDDASMQSFHAIQQDAVRASQALQKERMNSLTGAHRPNNRSQHWAELVPEWGLANNAAFIIGSRELSRSIDLKRRAFLHSYDHEKDPDGSILESILLGPMVVAHWINSQYYFSTVDPTHFGAGNKAIHNVLPNVGVIEGNQSDLKYGLPLQSISYRNEKTHEAMRLCVLIDAPREKIDATINKHPQLANLVNGRWVWLRSLRETV